MNNWDNYWRILAVLSVYGRGKFDEQRIKTDQGNH